MRALIFGRYADAEFGGLERHVHSLTQALANEVEYVNLVADRGLPQGEVKWNCEVVRVATVISLASMPICPSMPVVARRLHRRRPFDLIHLHFPDPMSHLAALALPKHLPVVITWHSDIIRQKRLSLAYHPLLGWIAARASAVIAATPRHHTSMPQLGRLVRDDQRAVVPYGFDLDALSTPHPKTAELRRTFGERMVFALGRHVYYKGFEYLLSAIAHVPNARLVLGGTGPLTERLKRQAGEQAVEDRVIFAGRIPDADLPAYYQACAVFSMPSVEPAEAFGIVQVEAMACGKPVVCCELDNAVTWINQHGTTGLVVPPRDPIALANALRTLLDKPDLAMRLGRQAAVRVRQEFSLQQMARGTMDVYAKVLSTPLRPT